MSDKFYLRFYVLALIFFPSMPSLFSNLQSKNWRCDDHGNYTHPKYQKLGQIEMDFNKLIKFVIYVGQKVFQSGYQTEIGEFIYMLNMNGYYDGVEVTAGGNASNSERTV